MVPLHLTNLTKRFQTRRGEVLAVDDISLEIAAGELFFLLGPSGCGKTTLLRMLAGFVDPTEGRVLFGDEDVTHTPPEKRHTALVFQNYALWPHMTVARNVAFGPEMRRVPAERRDELVRELLGTVRIAEKAAAKPMELSGGQQQRVALARALAVEPRCLLLDEPLSNLDAALRAAMRWEIRRIVKKAGTTAVYVTHDQAEALAIADRIALMKDGRIAQVGTSRDLYENPNSRFVAEFLGEANFVEATVASAGGGEAVLEAPFGRLVSTTGHAAEAGLSVTCCLRPESLGIAEAGRGREADNAFPALLEEWTHLGEAARFRVDAGGGVKLSGAAMPARPVAEVGQQITLRVDPRDVILLGE
jgi:iron(III) transport system ATP-binding protein